MMAYVVTGLTDGKDYTFSVQAQNGAGSGPSATSTAVTPVTATFTNIFTDIIMNDCVGCHMAGPAGLFMMSGMQTAAYNNLVNMPSGQCAGVTRVVPGSSAMSLLYQKVAGTQTCGVRMPAGGPYLCGPQISLFQSWIDNGATNN
jgi:hypothetical protein